MTDNIENIETSPAEDGEVYYAHVKFFAPTERIIPVMDALGAETAQKNLIEFLTTNGATQIEIIHFGTDLPPALVEQMQTEAAEETVN